MLLLLLDLCVRAPSRCQRLTAVLAVYIANEPFLAANPEKVKAFMRAVKRASDFLLADPQRAWAEYKVAKKAMDTPLNAKIFERSFAYMSRDCANVPRVRTHPRPASPI